MIPFNWVYGPTNVLTALLEQHYKALYYRVYDLHKALNDAKQAKGEVPTGAFRDEALRLQRLRTYEVAVLRVYNFALLTHEPTALIYHAIMETLGVKPTDSEKDEKIAEALARMTTGYRPAYTTLNNVTASMEVFHEACRLTAQADQMWESAGSQFKGLHAAVQSAQVMHPYLTKMVAQVAKPVSEMMPTGTGSTLVQANFDCIDFEATWGQYGASACIYDPRSNADLGHSSVIPTGVIWRQFAIEPGVKEFELELYAAYDCAHIHAGTFCVREHVSLSKKPARFSIVSTKPEAEAKPGSIGEIKSADGTTLYVVGDRTRGV